MFRHAHAKFSLDLSLNLALLLVPLRVWEDLELLFDMQMSSYRELKDANMADACSSRFCASSNLGPGLPGGVDLAKEPLGRRDAGALAKGSWCVSVFVCVHTPEHGARVSLSKR